MSSTATQMTSSPGSLELANHRFPNTNAEIAAQLPYPRAVLQAHGVNAADRPVLVCSNFILDAAANQPVVEPGLDAYLGFLGLNLASPGDTVLSLKTLPGLLEERRRLGILPTSAAVVEVTPIFRNSRLGYPATSPIAGLSSDELASSRLRSLAASQTEYAVATFMTGQERQMMSALGFGTVQGASPAATSNKIRFTQESGRFGYNVAPNVVLTSGGSLLDAARLLLAGARQRIALNPQEQEGSIIGAWMKAPGGSGGDLVKKLELPIAILSNESSALDAACAVIEQAKRALLLDLKRAHVNNDYGTDATALSDDELFPKEGLLVEQDARALGTVVANASNCMVLDQMGDFDVIGQYRQLTGPSGDYRGSYPWAPQHELGATFANQQEREFAAIARHAFQLGFRGLFGIDYFVIRTPDGQLTQVNTELNGRLSISGAAEMLARKLGAKHWVNMNLAAPSEIRSYEDFARQFSDHLFTPGDFSRVSIVPQAFRTLYGRTESGAEKCVESRIFKALLVGPSQDRCVAAALEFSGKFGK